MNRDLENIRSEYLRNKLEEANLPDEPFTLFNSWLEDAKQSENPQPTAMALSTIEKNGQPSSRIVLLKKLVDDAFIFYTNYHSKKATDIRGHFRVSALFFWPEMERQVKVSGVARKIEDTDSEDYFRSRPLESQIAAWASPQSSEIPDRVYLEKEFQKYREKYSQKDQIPKPPYWGGYAIFPSRIEFWQGREARLHDRIEFRKTERGWKTVRLAP